MQGDTLGDGGMASAMTMATATVTARDEGNAMVMARVTATETVTAMVMESNTEVVFWGQVAATTAMEWRE